MKIKKSVLTVLVIVFMLSLFLISGGCKSSEEAEEVLSDIVDTAINSGSFNTLVTALQAAGLVDALREPGPFTVFAPTDDAFALLPAGTIDALLQDIPTLQAILLYHVATGIYTAANLTQLNTLDMLNASTATISVVDGNVMIDNAMVVQADINCSNGVIHVIDAVIIP